LIEDEILMIHRYFPANLLEGWRARRPDQPALQSTDWDKRLNGENGFDIARLIFASLVVFEHSYFLPFNSYEAEPLYIWSKGQTDFGSLAVNGFFVISGFLITRSCLLTKDTFRYLEKRAARIIPGFLLASVLTILVFGPLGADNVTSYFQHLNPRATLVRVSSLHASGVGETLLHNPMKSIVDGTFWTIRYEFDCYILVAILWAFNLLTRGPVTIILAVLLLCFGLQSAGLIEIPTVKYGIPAIFISSPEAWPRLFGYFFAGAALYLWRDHIPKSPILLMLSILLLILGLRFGGAELVMLSAGIYCLFFIALSAGRSPRLFGNKVDLSYGIYLFGFPIQQLIIAATHNSLKPGMLFLISLPLTMGLAYLSWTFIENPSIRWAHTKRAVRVAGTTDLHSQSISD
jgi:peptidoglycan/LPS O-acetylase OafA/YrhL